MQAPVGRVFFTGEHTSERFNGYVHGGYLAGIDTGKSLLVEMKMKEERHKSRDTQKLLLEPLLALSNREVSLVYISRLKTTLIHAISCFV